MKWIAPSHRRYAHNAALEEYRRWFAWRPAFIDKREHNSITVPGHFVWLEFVERRLTAHYFDETMFVRAIRTVIASVIPTVKWKYRPDTTQISAGVKPPTFKSRPRQRPADEAEVFDA